MKKTYINPEMVIVEIKVQPLLLETSSVGVKTSGTASEWGARNDDFDWEDEE